MASSKSSRTDDSQIRLGSTGNSRYFDIGDLPKQTLLPISGYQYRELPALKLALKMVPDLPNMRSQIETAMDNCRHPPDGLTQNESAAIHIYTMEWYPRET
ncbi:unnamed protein product, partial [Rotaria sp. Silwood2]